MTTGAVTCHAARRFTTMPRANAIDSASQTTLSEATHNVMMSRDGPLPLVDRCMTFNDWQFADFEIEGCAPTGSVAPRIGRDLSWRTKQHINGQFAR
ncbi:hypothetical protein [Bradyrhizobium sp. USDA 4486]